MAQIPAKTRSQSRKGTPFFTVEIPGAVRAHPSSSPHQDGPSLICVETSVAGERAMLERMLDVQRDELARLLSEVDDTAARTRLVVMSRHVGQPGDWRLASDCGVGTVVIVEVEPPGKGRVAVLG